MDAHLTFRRHVEVVTGKATKNVASLSRLMPNVGGPFQRKRALLMTVVNSKLFYAAPTWVTKAMKFDVNIKMMNRALKNAAIHTIRAYRSVLAEAAQFLAGSPPGDLLAVERHRIRARMEDSELLLKSEIKKLEREITFNQWQARWSRGGKGEWTRRILPNIRR